jgi:DNA-binding transcriptional ArsR family regulator
MSRAPATRDCFNAIAEIKRRQVLDILARGERPVNDLVQSLGWPQPQVSKHLGVLKKVGLVSERRRGRQRVYRMNGEKLMPVHEWVRTFEHFWQHQLDRIKARAEEKIQKAAGPKRVPDNRKEGQ